MTRPIHSPGPLRAQLDTASHGMCMAIVDEQNQILARTCEEISGPLEQDKANAVMFAAAPILYAELFALVDELSALGFGRNDDIEGPEVVDVIADRFPKLKAALQRAVHS